MFQNPSVADLIPRSELQAFLDNFGNVINRCCAVVRFPSEEEMLKLCKYEKFLRLENPETPSDDEARDMYNELAGLNQSTFDIIHGQQNFCKLLRGSPLADLRCIYCNFTKSKEAYEKKEVQIYACHAGLTDMVVPLLAGKRHIGDLFIGQNYNKISQKKLIEMHKDYKLQCTQKEFIDAYNGLKPEDTEETKESVKSKATKDKKSPSLEDIKPLLQDLANFLSSYASTNLSNEIFPKLCFGVHVSTNEYHVINQFINGIREKYINFDSGSVWIKNKNKAGWMKCIWSNYQGLDKDLDILYRKGMMETDGLGGRVMKDKEKRLFNHAEIMEISAPKYLEQLRLGRNLRTFLGVPLKFDGDVSGFLEIGSREENAFDVSTIRMIEEAARYLSLYFSFKSDMKTMFSYLLSRNKDETLLQMAVQSIPEIIGGAACSIFKLSADRQFLECVATTGIMEIRDGIGLKSIRYPVNGKSLTSWVFKNTKIFLNNRKVVDCSEEIGIPTFHEKIIAPTGRQLSEEECSELSVMMIPLLDENNERAGVLRIVGKTGFGEFTDADMKIAESFAEVLLSNQISYINVFKVGMEMLNKNDMNTIIYQFITVITHRDGIGIHRAMVFAYDQECFKLEKIMAIGPADKAEADNLGPSLANEEMHQGVLDRCIVNPDEGIAEVTHSNLAGRIPDTLEVGERFRSRITANSKNISMSNYEISSDPASELEQTLRKLDVKTALLVVLQLDPERKIILVCDMIYGLNAIITEQQKQQLKVACDFFIRAEEIRNTVRNAMDRKKEWWERAERILRHNLGNNLTVLESIITEIHRKMTTMQTLTPEDCGIFTIKNLQKTINVNLPLELIRMAKRNISNLSAFDIKLEKKTVRLSTFNSEIRHHLSYSGSSPWNIDINWQLTNSTDILLEIDYERLLDCFDNLIKNVAECKPDNRKVWISCEVVTADNPLLPREKLVKSKYERYVVFSIRDNGPGIRPEDKRVLFEPYSSTKKEEHYGLGLAFIAYVLQRHFGDIYEIGEFGNGAHFKLFLPDVERNSHGDSIQIPRSNSDRESTNHSGWITYYEKENDKLLNDYRVQSDMPPWNMLIVEDNPLVLNRILKAFEGRKILSRPLLIKSAINVKDYLSQQKNTLFDVIILDLKLFAYGVECDDDGGLNISKYTQILNAGVVTILFSASLSVRDCVEAMRRGVWDCIDKNEPHSIELLKESVCKGLDSKIGTHDWMEKSMSALDLESYRGQYIAMVNGEIIASNTNIQELQKEVKSDLHRKATDLEDNMEPHEASTIRYIRIPMVEAEV